jgi:hypothetical protein
MHTTVSVRAFHRTALARFFAACLVILSISPFTAPFSTFDASEMLGETVVHAGHGSAKLVQETSDLGWAAASEPVLFVDGFSQLNGWPPRKDVHSRRSTVLRI